MQIIILHISGAINTILTWEHKKELVHYIYLHQVCITQDPYTTLLVNSKVINELYILNVANVYIM